MVELALVQGVLKYNPSISSREIRYLIFAPDFNEKSRGASVFRAGSDCFDAASVEGLGFLCSIPFSCRLNSLQPQGRVLHMADSRRAPLAKRSSMDIVQLNTLIHVAELGSVSKAADRLCIAQPALSRQIRLLEDELGVDLFERHGRGMVITEAGREVLNHAARIMAELDSIRSSVSSGHSSYRGTVMIGTTPTVSEIVTVPLVRKIQEAHPQLKVRLLSGFSGHLIDWVQRGELDIAVSYNPKPLKSLRIVPIMIEDLLFVSAGRTCGRMKKAIEFARLADEELILPSPRHGLRTIVEECAHQAGVELIARIEADSFSAMIDLVRNGFGSTVLPLAPIYSLVKSGALRAAPLVEPSPTRKLVLACSADRPISPAARFAAQALTEIAADLVKRRIWTGHMVQSSTVAKSRSRLFGSQAERHRT